MKLGRLVCRCGRLRRSYASIREISRKELEAVLPGEPVVCRQAYKDLPAGRWCDDGFQRLREVCSDDVMVPVELSTGGGTYAGGTGDGSGSFERAEFPLSHFLSYLDARRRAPHTSQTATIQAYLAQHDLFTALPQLYEEDVCDPSFVRERSSRGLRVPELVVGAKGSLGDLYNINVWIGLDSHTPLHNDPYHNAYLQVCGRKRVITYPGTCKDGLKFHRDGSTLRNTSTLKDAFDEVALAQMGVTEEILAQGKITELSSGDMLYMPRGTLHSFRSDDPRAASASVNWWFL
ncbi:hypothetical protein PYCC9005_003120 [Savitreella phatthalungensis]